MAGRIRVLDSANRTMQRLGYLKALAALLKEGQTSNLETLGKRLIARVTQRPRLRRLSIKTFRSMQKPA